MPDNWKTLPVNVGLLTALLAGVVSTVLIFHSVQLWVDSRIDSHLSPVMKEMEWAVERCEFTCGNRNEEASLLAYMEADCGSL